MAALTPIFWADVWHAPCYTTSTNVARCREAVNTRETIMLVWLVRREWEHWVQLVGLLSKGEW
jgi:hypothetical protein